MGCGRMHNPRHCTPNPLSGTLLTDSQCRMPPAHLSAARHASLTLVACTVRLSPRGQSAGFPSTDFRAKKSSFSLVAIRSFPLPQPARPGMPPNCERLQASTWFKRASWKSSRASGQGRYLQGDGAGTTWQAGGQLES